MYGKIINETLTYFVQPNWLIGDATNYAISQGYKQVIRFEGYEDYISETDTLITVTYKKIVEVPQEISMMKTCLMLDALGLLTQVEALINSDPTGTSQLAWRTCSTCVRTSNMIKSIAYKIGYNDAMMDEFFINASKIEI